MIAKVLDKNLNFIMQKNTYKITISLVLILFMFNKSTLAATPKSTKKNQEIVLSVPATINILSVNGQHYQSPSLIEGNYLISIPHGTRSLVAQYYENWNTIDESGNIIKWKPVKISYAFNSKSSYSLKHANVNDADDAENLVNTPEIWLSSDNKRVMDGVLIEKQNNHIIYAQNSTTLQPSSNSKENFELKAQIQALQQEVNTLKSNEKKRQGQMTDTFSFSDWEAFKSSNPEQYQRFKDYKEYTDFLKYRQKINK